MSVGCAVRTMDQPFACSLRCARGTLQSFVRLIRASLDIKMAACSLVSVSATLTGCGRQAADGFVGYILNSQKVLQVIGDQEVACLKSSAIAFTVQGHEGQSAFRECTDLEGGANHVDISAA